MLKLIFTTLLTQHFISEASRNDVADTSLSSDDETSSTIARRASKELQANDTGRTGSGGPNNQNKGICYIGRYGLL